MCPRCMKCGCTVFVQTCLVTYKETYKVEFYDDGQVDRCNDEDSDRYWEEDRSSYRCSKCGWELRDDQGKPLLKAEDIRRWVESHQDDFGLGMDE
jgi:hypothetical protein